MELPAETPADGAAKKLKKKCKKPFMMSEIFSDITEHTGLNTNSAVPHIQGLGSIDP